MPGTLVPAQMFDHELNPRKGWPSPYALDHRIQAFNSAQGIRAGMCLYKEPVTSRALRGAINGYMPLFAFQGQSEFDVNGDVGNIIGNWMNTLVATGAYELQTTEYVTDTYAPNDPLTSTTVGVNAGLLSKTTFASVNMIVGIVSEAGPTANDHGKNMITFWPVYAPYRHL